MNKVILMGRLTRDPDVRYSNGENVTAVARFTLAVDRRFARRDGDQQTADFYRMCSIWKKCRVYREIFSSGNACNDLWTHSDRILYEQRW